MAMNFSFAYFSGQALEGTYSAGSSGTPATFTGVEDPLLGSSPPGSPSGVYDYWLQGTISNVGDQLTFTDNPIGHVLGYSATYEGSFVTPDGEQAYVFVPKGFYYPAVALTLDTSEALQPSTETLNTGAISNSYGSITLSTPATIQVPPSQNGADISLAITASPAIKEVYLFEVSPAVGAVVLPDPYPTPADYQEVVPLVDGKASTTFQLSQSGDEIYAFDSLTAPTVVGISSPVTIIDSITISAPGTVQESKIGAGVNVTETIDASSALSHVDIETITALGAVESGWQVVPLQDGTATITVHFAHSGDYVHVADNETTPTVTDNSSAVTITEPPTPSISVGAPGTLQEAAPGAGVNAVVTVDTQNITGHIDVEVLTASGTVESGWQVIPISSDTATLTVHMEKSGDYIHVANNETTPTAIANSTPVTITDPQPTPSISVGAPGTVQESAPGKGVTVPVTIDTQNIAGHVDVEVLTATGAVESGWQVVPLASDTATVNVHFEKTGDYIHVVNNETTPTAIANSTPVTITDAPASPKFLISSVAESGGSILISGDKQVGREATIREYMDGKYLGTLRDGYADGIFAIHAAGVSAGTHELKLTLDGFANTATFDFTVPTSSGVTASSAMDSLKTTDTTHAVNALLHTV